MKINTVFSKDAGPRDSTLFVDRDGDKITIEDHEDGEYGIGADCVVIASAEDLGRIGAALMELSESLIKETVH